MVVQVPALCAVFTTRVKLKCFSSPCRREAVPVHVGRLQVEVRTVGRANAPLPQTHGPETLQVSAVSAVLLAVRPPIAAHEAALRARRRQG